MLVMLVEAISQQSTVDRGLEAFRRRDFDAARRYFEEAIREHPRRALGYKLLGMTYVAQERYQLAEEPLRQACTLDSREENACYYLGRVLYFLNRFTEAKKAFEVALHSARTRHGQVLLGLALTLEALGETNPAEESYKQAIAAGEQRALIDYGLFLFHHGRGTEGLDLLRKAGALSELERVQRALNSTPGSARSANVPSAVQFEARPLGMVVRNGASGEKHQVETMIAGVAVFDYDNDGWPDIFVANGAAVSSLEKVETSFRNRLFRNNHDGTFTDVTEQAGLAGEGYSMGVAAADFDNDGWTDLFVTGVSGNRLYRNQGDGTFAEVTARAGLASNGGWSIAAGWFDYDRDGRLDLFVVRYVAWSPATEPYCGLFEAGYRTYCHPKYYGSLPNALYHNEGQGKFRDVSQESGIAAYAGKGMGVVFGDYDGDGWPDVFVANDTVPNFLFHNERNGRFTEVAEQAGVAFNEDGGVNSSMGADFRDYDNDGREDLIVTALSNERFTLYRNLGGGMFGDASGASGISGDSLPWSGWSTGMFDFNNDGLKDLFIAAGNVNDNSERISSVKSRQPNLVFLNRGDGTFQMQSLPGEALHRGAAFGDFDKDGRIDVVATRLNEAPLVLRNVSRQTGHWIVLQLRGTRSNRDGIGARVHLVAPSSEQWNRVTTSVGYAGSSERTVHFGLGKDNKAVVIEIEWPSGARQILRDVPADEYVSVEER
jgi:Tfp pilus assembly protein PilF